MSEPKQVKVDNWGVYFLQRLKHFFNRTDYCDLTLQFQDNAQLKVHRLVLNACTEYFELLERTCEMYEDCLVMPDDLQADVVVPIVNFMYTGQLEFRMDILEGLHATSEIMNMPVLTKLLDSHRVKGRQSQSYAKRAAKQQSQTKPTQAKTLTSQVEVIPTTPAPKRSYTKALETKNIVYRDKKYYMPVNKPSSAVIIGNGGQTYRSPSPIPLEAVTNLQVQKFVAGEPRPTRYELPEELDSDYMFQNSFCNISYTSQPLMVHPDTTKQYAKRPKLDKGLPSTSKRSRSTILDIVECKRIEKETDDNIFEESTSVVTCDETEMFKPSYPNHVGVKTEPVKVRDPNKLFDQLLDQKKEHAAKVTIETPKNNKAGANLDHAKIISEVLKKYPHLVKSNKNIKLKIFNSPSTGKASGKKQKLSPQPAMEKVTNLDPGFTYETDVLDSKQAARLIALGAENIEGPWICLICGAPGKAMHFTNYYMFRRHLVEVHNEKPVLNICEYCGQRITKRNYLLHHLYTKHGVPPPPTHNFPKCPQCNYIALTEALLVKHKLSHAESKQFRCNVCPSSFNSSNQLLVHIQCTGHKYIPDRKHSHQCIYCLKIFLRENNLYAHLKTHHRLDAEKDGIIDQSDDDETQETFKPVKNEPGQSEFVDNSMEYHIQQKPDGNLQLIHKKPAVTTIQSPKQKILNSGLTLDTPKAPAAKSNHKKNVQIIKAEHTQEEHTQEEHTQEEHTQEENTQDDASPIIQNEEGYIVIDNNEYEIRGNQLILRNTKEPSEEFILSDMTDKEETVIQPITPSTSMGYASLLSSNQNIQQANIILKDTQNLSESIPIYVSNEEEYRALMVSSNENIIFDATDSNKTLAVLTTPDAATLDNAGINLDDSHNNDMVIIQEQYPMNVTESVAADNSNNIVVVYSHQMGDQNKEYQLLTTQSLGPQYVQTSTMMTQNYESVSTSSPVTSAHILEPQATWHNVIAQTTDNQHPENNDLLESIVQTEVQATNAPELVDENIVSDLPQVEITPIIQCTNNNETEDLNTDQPETSENLPDDETIREIQIMSMEVDVPEEEEKLIEENYEPTEKNSETLVEAHNNSDNAESLVHSDSVIQADSLEMEQEQVLENVAEAELHPEVTDIDNKSPADTHEGTNTEIQPDTASNTNENVTSIDIQLPEENVNTLNVDNQSADDDVDEVQANIVAVSEISNVEEDQNQLDTDNDLCAPEVVVEIQSLASEWEEENMQTPVQDTTEEPSVDNTNSQKTPELEESIENIEQELKKQMIEVTPSDDKIETVTDKDEQTVGEIETTGEIISQSESNEPNPLVNPQVKISSLLNDWDDNDSQEDGMIENVPNDQNQINESSNPNPEHCASDLNPEVDNTGNVENETGSPSAMADDHEITDQTTAEQQNVQSKMIGKQDNIKSLVSDWDDEEDDENKQ